jgi:signal transduction histidine kinase
MIRTVLMQGSQPSKKRDLLIAKIIPMHRNQDYPSFLNSNKSYVSLTIEDDGMGMDEETRSKIFDPV